MRGQIEVVNHQVQQHTKMVNLAATPAPRLAVKEDYTKRLKYEQHYGRSKEQAANFEKGAIHAASLKAGNLSERLIKVLKEEENLGVSEVVPIMRQNYFQEIYESKRGQTLKLYGAELSSAEEEEKKNSDDH